jgi:hypothetical protein
MKSCLVANIARAFVALFGILAAAFAVTTLMLPRGDSPAPGVIGPQFPGTAFPESVSGVVVGPAGPIHGAMVRWQGYEVGAEADENGRFILPPTDGARRISASAVGHYSASVNVGSGRLRIALARLPIDDDVHYAWIDPSPTSESSHRCSDCHERIFNEWQRSAHARSASGGRFLDLIEGTDAEGADVGWSLRRDHPHGVAVCNACHAPTIEPADPAWLRLAGAQGTVALGVHCDYCHKVHDLDRAGIGLTHGRYAARLSRPPPESQVFFGPLDDANQDRAAFAAIFRDSLYCAGCHEGTVFGVRAYTTYSEWQASPAGRRGQQCQECHMAAAAEVVNAAPGHGGIDRRPATLSDHSMFGAGTKRLGDVLHLSLHHERCEAGVKVEVCLDSGEVGHRVPTGFVDRHVLLMVEATDAAGVGVESVAGPLIPKFVGPSVAGRPGRVFAKVLFRPDGSTPAPFWGAEPEYVDSRLDPSVIERATFIFGHAAATVRVRVLHRDFWESVRVKKKWTDDTVVVLDRQYSVAGIAR